VRAVALGAVLLIAAAGCGESDEGGQPPNRTAGGGSINVTFSGAVNGTSTKLVRTDCKVAARQHAGHEYGMSLWTELASKQYELALDINGWSGPVSLTLPRGREAGNQVLFQVKENGGRIFLSDTMTSGTIIQGSDLMSGSYDLHRLSTFSDEVLDLKATYKCT
jgi:hypothetical protein